MRTLIVLSLLPCLAGSVVAQGYSIEIVASRAGGFGQGIGGSLGPFARIDANGRVYYSATFPAGLSTGTGIYATVAGGEERIVATGDSIDGFVLDGIDLFDVSNNGTVVLVATSGARQLLVRATRNEDDTWTREVLVRDGDTIGAETVVAFIDIPRINDSGVAAFWAELAAGEGILTQDRVVARTGDTVDGRLLSSVRSPDINDAGEVAFVGTGGYFVEDRLAAEVPGGEIGGVTLSAEGEWVKINRVGEIAFDAESTLGTTSIFTQDEVLVPDGLVIDGEPVSPFGPFGLSINDSREVAFSGEPAGIYTQHRWVMRRGAPLLQSTVLFLQLPEINRQGQIVFRVSLMDGSSAVVLATPPDSDGDGIRDLWEELPFVVADPDGTAYPVDLQPLGAHPRHKDLFVWIDYFSDSEYDHRPPDLTPIIQAFDAAPVANPDGDPGITLHAFVSPEPAAVRTTTGQAEPFVMNLGSLSPTNSYRWFRHADDDEATIFFDDIRNGDPSRGIARHFPRGLESAIRYCLFAHQIAGLKDSGIARGTPGNDCIVSLGAFIEPTEPAPRKPPLALALGTFMHELGHVLGLKHGGGDETNHKPNYLSVMNYSFQRGVRKDGATVFDFSRIDLPDLEETALSEADGVQGWPQEAAGFETTWFKGIGGSATQEWSEPFSPLLAAAIDWNLDGAIAESTVSASVNRDVARQTLAGFDDWSHITFAGGVAGGGIAAPPPGETPVGELDVETAKQIRPAPVLGLAARAGRGSARLAWNPGGVTGDVIYRVFRKLQGAAAFTEIGTTQATLYSDRGLVSGQSYLYTVTMVDGLGIECTEAAPVTVRVR